MADREVMDIAAGIASAMKVNDLSHPPTTGADAQRQFARMYARLVAQYRLAAVPGRPEELVRPGTSRGVSLGYGCKTIRVRLMLGREWESTRDFQIKDGWAAPLYEFCDAWFEQPKPTPASVRPRPIRDNPQG